MTQNNPKMRSTGITIMDTTLRDGEQAPGVVFDTKARIEIAQALAYAGVDEIEVGIPAMGKAAREDIRNIVRLNLGCLLTSWCRAVQSDIELAADCRTGGVHISFPCSAIHLNAMAKDEAWVIQRLYELIPIAKSHFDRVSIGAQDATRASVLFLSEFARTAAACGADRLRIADTVGIARPSTVRPLIHAIKTAAPDLSLEFHAHNDLGMATANAVTAAESGASALSVTVNGLGERAGNAALEEVAMALFGMGEFYGNIDLKSLVGLSRLIAAESGRALSCSKPVTGSGVFRHESGIHCAGLLKNPETFEPFHSSLVGQPGTEVVIGTHSGTSALIHVLSGSGISLDRKSARRLLESIRNLSREHKRSLSITEILEVVSRVELTTYCTTVN